MDVILSPTKKSNLEFQRSTFNFDPPRREWSWKQIRELLNENQSLYTIRKTTVSNSYNPDIIHYAEQIYGMLPESKTELRTLRDHAKDLFNQSCLGSPGRRDELKQYRDGLRGLIWGCRLKLGTVLTTPNYWKWSKKGYALFLDLQQNLGKNRRVFFLTITFKTLHNYVEARKELRGFTKNVLNRLGFYSMSVIAYHATRKSERRLHAHILFWPREERIAYHHKAAVRRVATAMSDGRYGIGRVDLKLLRGAAHFLRVAAYVAYNYDEAVQLDRNQTNPIPPGARILSTPNEVVPGRKWQRCKKFSFVTPATVAWRRAVCDYSAARGLSQEGNYQWMWQRRRDIRKYLRPELFRRGTLTGLDGLNYVVKPFASVRLDDEWYVLENETKGAIIVEERDIEILGKLNALGNSLRVDLRLDPSSGRPGYICW